MALLAFRLAQGWLRAPRACPEARQDLAKPAQGRPWLADELRKACPALLRALESYPQARQDLAKACPVPPRLAEELRKACPELLRAPESYPEVRQELSRSCPEAAQELPGKLSAWTARSCHKTAAASLNSIRPKTLPKKRPNMLSSSLSTSLPNVSSGGGCREAELDSK